MDDPRSDHPDSVRLLLFASGRLRDAELAGVEAHLASCDACCRALEQVPEDEAVRLIRRHGPKGQAPPAAGDGPAGGIPTTLSPGSPVTTTLTPAEAGPPPPIGGEAAVLRFLPAELVAHPRYRILAPLGRGSFGFVFLAEDIRERQSVALKVLRGDLLEQPGWVARFAREAEAARRLEHPHIVALKAAEQFGKVNFLVLEYIDGIDLARLIARRGPLPVAVASELMRQAADGLQHAHERGLVHRDFKPTNLMVTAQGQVKILDFGLARLLGEARAESGPTSSGAIIGTLDYMAPEQAEDPRTADTRADVYSLGCTLYALLAGHPPFPEGSFYEKLEAHARATPRPLSALRPDVPAGLEAAIGKMMAKDPGRRFQTPRMVAECLAFFSDHAPKDGAPIMPLALGEVASAAVHAAPAAADGPPGVESGHDPDGAVDDPSWVACWLDSQYVEVTAAPAPPPSDGRDEPRRPAVPAGARPRPSRELERRRPPETPRRRFRWEWAACLSALIAIVGLVIIRVQTDRGELVIETEDPSVIVRVKQGGEQVAIVDTMTNATVTLASGTYNLELAGGDADLRLSTDAFTLKRGDKTIVSVHRMPLTPQEPRAVAEMPAAPVFDARLPTMPANGIRLDSGSFEVVQRFVGHSGVVGDVALSPDGRRALTGSNDLTIRLWEVASGKELRRFAGHTVPIHELVFTPDGRRFLSCSRDGTVRLWDVATGQEIRRFEGHRGEVWGAALSPDGTRVLTGCHDSLIRLFDVETGREIRRLEGHTTHVPSVAFSPDGRRVLSCANDKTVRLWDVDTGRELRRLDGYATRRVTFSPDGHRALFNHDALMILWDVETGQEIRRFTGHGGNIYAMAFTPDGRSALSASNDNTIRLWDLASGQERARYTETGEFYGLAVSPDGHYALTNGSYSGIPKLLRLPTFARPAPEPVALSEVRRFVGHANQVMEVAVAAEGRRMVSGSMDGSVRVWEVETGRPVRVLEGHEGWIMAVAISPDGRRALSGGQDKVLRLWDLEAGQLLKRLEGHADWILHVSFTPDGHRALSCGGGSWNGWFQNGTDFDIWVWDLETGAVLAKWPGHTGMIDALDVSSDGRRALSSSGDGTVRIWDPATGKTLHQLPGQTVMGLHAILSPDGRYAVATADGNVARVWEVESGREVCQFRGHRAKVDSLAVSPDSRLVVSGSWPEQMLRLWDLTSGREIGQIQLGTNPQVGAFLPDGRSVVWPGTDGTVRLISWPGPAPDPSERVEGDEVSPEGGDDDASRP